KFKEVEVAGVFKAQPQNSSFFYRESFMNFENVFDENDKLEKSSWKESTTLFVQIKDSDRVGLVEKQLQEYRANNNKVRDDFFIKAFTLDSFANMAHTDRAEDVNSWTWDAFPISAVIGSAIMAILILLISCFNL